MEKNTIYESIRNIGKSIGNMLEYFYREFHKENPLEVYQTKQQIIDISKEYFKAFDEVKSRKQLVESLTGLFIKTGENETKENGIENESKDRLEKFIVDAKKIFKCAENLKEVEIIYATSIYIPDDEKFIENRNLCNHSAQELSKIYHISQKDVVSKMIVLSSFEKQENNKKK